VIRARQWRAQAVIQFPGDPPPEGYSEEYIAKLHAAAFRDLEHDLCECVSISKIAADLVFDLDQRLRDGNISSEVFAASHLHNMLTNQKKRYYALWEGEERPS
jgi:hypothetical protein